MFQQENNVPVQEFTQRSLQNASNREISSKNPVQDVKEDDETNNRNLSLYRHSQHQTLNNRNAVYNSVVYIFASQQMVIGLSYEEQDDLNRHQIRLGTPNAFSNDTHFDTMNQVTTTAAHLSHESILPRNFCPRGSQEETRQDPDQIVPLYKEVAGDDCPMQNDVSSTSLDETPAEGNRELPTSEDRGTSIYLDIVFTFYYKNTHARVADNIGNNTLKRRQPLLFVC